MKQKSKAYKYYRVLAKAGEDKETIWAAGELRITSVLITKIQELSSSQLQKRFIFSISAFITGLNTCLLVWLIEHVPYVGANVLYVGGGW